MRASFTAWSCGLIGFGSVALGACGGGNFSVPEELHADADAGADASAPVDDPKATVEAGAGDAASQPPPVVPVPPVACDEAPDLANHAFVSATAGVAGTCGPSTAPCKTIAEAIVWAKANGRTKIIVDKGTYTESLTLAKGIFIQGGWAKSDGWKRICDDKERAASVVIEAPVTQTITALAEDLGGTATLDTVNLRSKETAAPGESLYGLVVRGASSKVVLTGVGITKE